MKRYSVHLKPLLLGIMLMSLIFIVEIKSTLLVGTVAYVLVELYVLWLSRKSSFLVISGIMTSSFIVLPLVLLFENVIGDVSVIVDRSISLAVVWLAVYITVRFRKLYAERHSKREQLNSLFENANEGILFTDSTGKIVLVNPFLEKMFGYEPLELLNNNVGILIPERFSICHAQHIRAFVVNPESKSMGRDLWGKHKSGREFPVEINLSHFYNEGQLTVIAFFEDLTEKKRQGQLLEENLNSVRTLNLHLEEMVKQRTIELEILNRELTKSQQLYKAMAHNFPDGIIGVLDNRVKYLLADGKGLNELGLKEGAVIGERIFDDVHSTTSKYAEEELKKVYEGESVSFDVELKEKVYNINSVPIPDESEINEILVVIKNITSQKKLEKDLTRTVEKERELNVLKSRFVSMASHEFRTPLTTILSSTFLLENYTGDQLEKEKRKHIDRIKRSVHGLTELLNDFLSVGKLEEGKVRVVYCEINLPQFVEELLEEVSLVKKDDQKFQMEYIGNEKSVTSDKVLLRNILMNLISNAIKYSPNSTTIKVSVSVANQKMTIRIADQGIGIPPEDQKHIFKRFYRAVNASGIQGTGLGLNIVKKYVRMLKGNIEFTSRPGETIFTVSVPVILPEQTLDNQYKNESPHFIN